MLTAGGCVSGEVCCGRGVFLVSGGGWGVFMVCCGGWCVCVGGGGPPLEVHGDIAAETTRTPHTRTHARAQARGHICIHAADSQSVASVL